MFYFIYAYRSDSQKETLSENGLFLTDNSWEYLNFLHLSITSNRSLIEEETIENLLCPCGINMVTCKAVTKSILGIPVHLSTHCLYM